jgi:hypothetical protein
MSTSKKTTNNEYIYGYALSLDGEFYSQSSGDVGPLEECDFFTEEQLPVAVKQAEKDLDQEVEKVAIVIREL